MWRTRRGMLVLCLLAGSGAVVACGSRDSGEKPIAEQASADVIDVSSGASMSLALQGGLGPILSDQTITKATMSLGDIELVDANGGSVVLSSEGFTGDLVALQDQLGQIFSDRSVQAGRYTAMRFRLKSAWIEAQDAQGANTVYATQGVDSSQFSDVGSVQALQLAGLDSDGFVTCALPSGGITVGASSSLAVQFAFAQSLQVQSGGAWVLTPRCWLVDQSTFSSLDVDFQMSSQVVSSYRQYWESGFQVMLLDSNLYPVCEVPLAVYQSTIFRAHFVYLSSFLGPFVAALVPPVGFQLQSAVAVQVDVTQSAFFSAFISVTSFSVESGHSFAIGTDRSSRIERRDRRGHLLGQTNQAIGAVEDVAPTRHNRQPVAPGQEPPPPAETPHLPGNPPPRMGHRRGEPGMMPAPTPTGTEMMPPTMPTPTSTEHGKMPPVPTSTEHGKMPPVPTSTEHGNMPPAPTSMPTEHGMMPPAPPSTSRGRGRMPPAPPPTAPNTAPPAPKGPSGTVPPPVGGNSNPQPTGGPSGPPSPPTPTPTPAMTGAPPSPPSGGRGAGRGGPTPPSGGPSMSIGGPPPTGGGRGVGGGAPTPSGGPRGRGDGGGRMGH